MIKEIVQKIIDILKAADDLKDINFYFGVPRRRRYPFCYVKWVGGPIVPESSQADQFNHDYYVVVGSQSEIEDVAEKYVMDKVERIREVLKANKELDGLVHTSRVSSMEGGTLLEERFNVSLAAVTLYTEKEVEA